MEAFKRKNKLHIKKTEERSKTHIRSENSDNNYQHIHRINQINTK